ncbi:MAG TPA: 30S ribosomal protein S6 [Anaerolineaceae bacterium]|jgi:small subunit ribosomal protein S6
MRNYELVFIAHPELDETALNVVIEKVKSWIVDAGGSIAKVDLWGRRRLAYTIRKQREGQYVLINAQMAPTFSAELDRNMRFLEPVMRFMLLAVD